MPDSLHRASIPGSGAINRGLIKTHGIPFLDSRLTTSGMTAVPLRHAPHPLLSCPPFPSVMPAVLSGNPSPRATSKSSVHGEGEQRRDNFDEAGRERPQDRAHRQDESPQI